ncbi:general substrate transporter [Auriculariales sp. MPI-PUGE-AT-0066]|nr:general substrate transporter [Auriculariales sp. MPI-PUGE-AT-0066]
MKVRSNDDPSWLTILRQRYTWCAVFVSLGGFLFGLDTGSIGPVTVMPQFYDHFGHIPPAKHGLIGPLADRISRTRTIALGGLMSAIGEAICIAAPKGKVGVFIAGRAIAGIGEGLAISPITTYTCEIAPTAVRGRLTVQTQLFITLGILCGYFTCYGTVHLNNDFAWRTPYIFQVVCSLIMAAGSLLLPHSPRWLKHVGRDADAEKSMRQLGVTADDLGFEPPPELRAPLSEKTDEAAPRRDQQSTDVKETWLSPWRKIGIDGILYYAPTVFAQAGLKSNTASFLASGVIGLVNFVVTIPALIYSDKWGRRPPLIWGGLILSLALLIIASLHASHASDHKGGQYAVIALIFVYIISFAMSWAVVIRGYVSEIQPMRTRGPATALGQAMNWMVNWTIAFTTPLFLAKSTSGPYFLFGGCSMLTTIVCVFFARESLGISLEDIEKEFDLQWTPNLSRTTTERTSTSRA